MIFILSEDDVKIHKDVCGIYFFNSSLPQFMHKKMIELCLAVEDNKNVKIFAIDLDHFKLFSSVFDLSSVPTTIIFKNSKEIKRISNIPDTKTFLSEFDI